MFGPQEVYQIPAVFLRDLVGQKGGMTCTQPKLHLRFLLKPRVFKRVDRGPIWSPGIPRHNHPQQDIGIDVYATVEPLSQQS